MKYELNLNRPKHTIAAVARMLNMSRPTLYKRIEKNNWKPREVRILKESGILAVVLVEG